MDDFEMRKLQGTASPGFEQMDYNSCGQPIDKSGLSPPPGWHPSSDDGHHVSKTTRNSVLDKQEDTVTKATANERGRHISKIRILDQRKSLRNPGEFPPVCPVHAINVTRSRDNKGEITHINPAPDPDTGVVALQKVSQTSGGFSVKRYLPPGSGAGSLNAYRRGEEILQTPSSSDNNTDSARTWSSGRRLSDVTPSRPQQEDVHHQLHKGDHSGCTNVGIMSGEQADGVTNPAYEQEPLQEDTIDLEDVADSAVIQIGNDEGQDNPVKNGPGSTKKTPTAQITPTVQITDMSTKSDDVTISVTDEHGQGVPLNKESKSKQVSNTQSNTSKLAESLKKAEMTPDSLDVNDEDNKWLVYIEQKFKEIAGADGVISKEEFKEALKLKKFFFAERFFELFDQDNSGFIELAELMDGLHMLMKGTPAQRLRFLFDVYDVDGSGTIEREELKCVLQACMEESSMSLSEDNLDDLTDVLFDAADQDESGEITFEELQVELEKHPGVIENLTISAAQWLKPPQKKKAVGISRYFTKRYLENNVRKVVFFLVYWALNIVLFAVAMWQYRNVNGWIMVARGCGLCLNFNCMFVLVLMLRKCITFLRMTKLCVILPFDQHIMFHKMVAIAIALFSFVHTIAHIGNAVLVTQMTPLLLWEVLFTTKAGVGWVGASAFITGWILDVILVVMVICSMPFVRRSGHFQVFYWTHMLYIPFWILVILHGPHFWKWFIVPGVIFLLEKVSRSKFIKMARFGDTFIEEVNLLPSGVTHLVISRPLNFKYQPGDYIFIQIPVIAKQEWHPFTISSAPEMDGHIWLHVRSAGHWTNKLYAYFDNLEVDEAKQKSLFESRTASAKKLDRPIQEFVPKDKVFSRKGTAKHSTKSTAKKRLRSKVVKVKCYIDGPYGTGTREVFDTNHAVLVGAGIGVTPMAAILQSTWYRFNATKRTCPNCEHAWYDEEETQEMKLKKVDFIWINRDQKSFEWFLTLLNQLEVEQSTHHGALENSIQMHMYMTAAQQKTDMKGIGLQIALDLMYDKHQKDLITGLKTKTEPGRPDWDKVFTAIKNENRGRVKVFLCGPSGLAKPIKEACGRFKFDFSKENF